MTAASIGLAILAVACVLWVVTRRPARTPSAGEFSDAARRYADLLCAYQQAVREWRGVEWVNANMDELSQASAAMTPADWDQGARLMGTREVTPL